MTRGDWIPAIVGLGVGIAIAGLNSYATVASRSSDALSVTLSLPEGASIPQWKSETDPFRRCAMKAIAGEFGELADWQEAAYRWGLVQGVTVDGTATLTSYYPQEGFPREQTMRSGIGVSERYAAVLQREWHNLRYYYIWVQPTKNRQGQWIGGIRQIGDTGANSNHRRFGLRYGSDRWVDFWYPQPRGLVTKTPYAIIKTDRTSIAH